MSIHPSLRGASTLIGERSVYTRIERVQKLVREGKMEEDASPFGLPKVRTRVKVKSSKVPAAEAKPDAGDDAEAAVEEGQES